MAQAIAAARTIHEVFRAVFRFTAATTPSDGIFVALYSPRTHLRRCVYAAGVVRAPDGSWSLEEDEDLSVFPELPLNEGPQSLAIVRGEVVRTPDLKAATRGLSRVDTGSDFDERPPRSSLAVPLATDDRILGAFEVQSTELDAFKPDHIPALEMAARLAAIAVQNLGYRDRERAQHEAVLRSLGLALEYRDYETKGHTDRVVAMSVAFGHVLELEDRALQAIRWGAYLHDLGKVAMPDQILLKPGRLDPEERAVIERHTLIGEEMCRDIPFLDDATRAIVRNHHERWDGKGYPDSKIGEDTLLYARMFSLVDVYDALTSERPYKRAWTVDDTLTEIRGQAGAQFDPSLIAPFEAALARVDLESMVG